MFQTAYQQIKETGFHAAGVNQCEPVGWTVRGCHMSTNNTSFESHKGKRGVDRECPYK